MRQALALLTLSLVLPACIEGMAMDGTAAGHDVSLDSLVRELEESQADPRPFARNLADSKADAILLGAFPGELGRKALAVRDQLTGRHNTVLPDGIGQTTQSLSERSDRAAVLIIANGGESGWRRNLIEWAARTTFDTTIAKNYNRVYTCTGEDGTWHCFRTGLIVTTYNYAKVDVFIQAHGLFLGDLKSYAYDNNGEGVDSTVLDEGYAPHYRYGMFMNCYSARYWKSGFPQRFVSLGGVAAYGAPGVSTPSSDLAFQLYFGDWEESFEESLSMANIAPVDQFSRGWFNSSNGGGDDATQKLLFGDGDVYVDG